MEKNNGYEYEALMRPGGFEFAIKAIKVSVPAEKQKELILHLAKIVLLVIEYAKQEKPPEVKIVDMYEAAERLSKLREGVVENPPS
jgi:hypothetical protein